MNGREAGQGDFSCYCASFFFSNWDAWLEQQWWVHVHFRLEHARLRAALKCWSTRWKSRACGPKVPVWVLLQSWNTIYVSDCEVVTSGCFWVSVACVCGDDWNNITPSHRRRTPEISAIVRSRVVVAAVTSYPDARQRQAMTSVLPQCSKTAIFHEQEFVIKSINNYLSQFLEISFGFSCFPPSGTMKKV